MIGAGSSESKLRTVNKKQKLGRQANSISVVPRDRNWLAKGSLWHHGAGQFRLVVPGLRNLWALRRFSFGAAGLLDADLWQCNFILGSWPLSSCCSRTRRAAQVRSASSSHGVLFGPSFLGHCEVTRGPLERIPYLPYPYSISKNGHAHPNPNPLITLSVFILTPNPW